MLFIGYYLETENFGQHKHFSIELRKHIQLEHVYLFFLKQTLIQNQAANRKMERTKRLQLYLP